MHINERTVGLLCPRCGAELGGDDDSLSCTVCDASYPVVDGIPRLLDQDFYWGEIQKGDARRLVDDARTLGWREAVAKRFKESDAAWISILDWQRASWIPLLGLPRESVVLDIGSGYGVLTHALAANFDEVHSVEAIPERVEFTSERMRQEGLDNVHLVQGSALQLPYPPASFDAIIVNGVLEWIGDWDHVGTPREAQLRFLRRLHTLLKPNGRLLIGIENRLGYVSLGGAMDHSGLPYTNLLPRPLATLALRTFASRHHRMVAPSRTYRTYTYSERGYRRLFKEAKFERNDAYWAEPGYNLPYRLAPLTRESVRDNLIELQTHASLGKPLSIVGRVKRALAKAGVFQLVVPDFIFILRKAGAAPTNWEPVLPADVAKEPQFALTTQPFGTKTTIRATAPGSDGVILKCSTLATCSRHRLATELAELESIAAKVGEHRAQVSFGVPTPLDSLELGRQLVTLESHAPGLPVSNLLFQQPASQRLAFLQTWLPRLAEVSTGIAKLSRHDESSTTSASWVASAGPVLPKSFVPNADKLVGKYGAWKAHGDFTVENVLLDLATNELTVIDWEFVRNDVPPLFDLFTLFIMMLGAIEPPASVTAKVGDKSLAQFYAAFFDENDWSALFARCVAREAEALGVNRADLWDMFVDFMILRVGYLVERKSAFAASRIRYMEAMPGWKDRFQLK